MANKHEISFLEKLVKSGCITGSDSKILRLLNENEDLKVLQSKDAYNWHENTGKAEYIISKLRPKNITYLDEKLDLFLVDKEKLKEAGNSYLIENDLFVDNFSEKDSIPNLKSLGLHLNDGMVGVDLSDYSLMKSERYTEYPDKLEGRENLTRSMLAGLYSERQQKRLTFVYRQTINNKVVVGSRLYILESGSNLKTLDKDKNSRLVSFMAALDYWHDNELNEGNATISKFGEGPNSPSYLSLYY